MEQSIWEAGVLWDYYWQRNTNTGMSFWRSDTFLCLNNYNSFLKCTHLWGYNYVVTWKNQLSVFCTGLCERLVSAAVTWNKSLRDLFTRWRLKRCSSPDGPTTPGRPSSLYYAIKTKHRSGKYVELLQCGSKTYFKVFWATGEDYAVKGL